MKRVIVIEDDPGISEMLAFAFQGTNIDLTCFDNGEVIMEGKYERPDLFLLDKQLPGVDGLDICRYLKSKTDTSKIPVVMMSANLRIAELAGHAGADDMIMKPFNITELTKLLHRHLGS